jgi:hypothetical protein
MKKVMKKENQALITEVDTIIKSLERRLYNNKYNLRQLAEDNRVIKRELSTCIRLKNLIKKEEV